MMTLCCKFAFAQAAKPAHPDPVKNPAVGVVLMDADTQQILYSWRGDDKFEPASMTKMITAYLAFEDMAQGKIDRQKKLYVSKNAASRFYGAELRAGSSISVDKALLALLLASSNDAAFVLAEGLNGSTSAFVRRMNETAQKLGLSDTRFTNPSGWEFPKQYSTPTDMAKLLNAVIRDYPDYYKEYFGCASFTLNGETHRNHNRLLRGNDKDLKAYLGNDGKLEGMDGGKTGRFKNAGSNIAASALRDGRRLTVVVQKSPSYLTRDPLVADLLDYGFLTFRDPTLTFPMSRAAIDSLKAHYNNISVVDPVVVAADSTAQPLPALLPAPLTITPIIPDILKSPGNTLTAPLPRNSEPGPRPPKYDGILRRDY